MILFRSIIILLFLICCGVNNLTAQHDILKGRILGLPILNVYSIGVGYERIFSNKVSVQMIYNNHGYNWSDNDGGGFTINSLTADSRYYLGNKNSDFSKSLFVGFFAELSNSITRGGGEQFIEDGPILINEKQMSLSPGIVLGFNIKLSDFFRLEFLYGRKHRFIREKIDFHNTQGIFMEIEKYHKGGMRLELNVGYKFN